MDRISDPILRQVVTTMALWDLWLLGITQWHAFMESALAQALGVAAAVLLTVAAFVRSRGDD